MALLTLITLLLAPARAGCEDPAGRVDLVEQAVLEARFDDARTHMAEAEAAFGCTGTADNGLLARIWLAEGAMAHVEGDPDSRDQAFASAARVSPGTFNDAYGDELRAAWEAAAGAPMGLGQLALEGLSDDAVAMVDGKTVQVPASLISGLYLVQADAGGGPPVFSRIVLVPDDQTLVVTVDDPSALASATVQEPSRRTRWPWYAAAGGAAVLSGTSAVLASRQDGGMEDATNLDQLDGAYGRQKGFAYASYGLAGASAALLGVGLVW
jgi:hypothetical protein